MNRFDIADAHFLLECHYNVGGILWERPSNQRRNESTGVQLARMGHQPGMGLDFDSMEDDGKEVYLTNVLKLNLPRDAEQNQLIGVFFGKDWLEREYPHVAAECFLADMSPRP